MASLLRLNTYKLSAYKLNRHNGTRPDLKRPLSSTDIFVNALTIAIATIAFQAAPVNAEIYRVVNPDGSISYTDKPAASEKESASTVEIEENNANVSDSPETVKEREPDWLKAAREQRQAKEQEAAQVPVEKKEVLTPYQAWKQEYENAKQAVKDAEKALKAGMEVRDGDFIGFTSSRTGTRAARPSEAYIKRVESLEASLKDAKKKLAKIKKRKPR